MKNTKVVLPLILATALFSNFAKANLCSEVRNSSAPTDSASQIDADMHQAMFPNSRHTGNRSWNRKILVCNRKRDTKGDEVKKVMTDSAFRAQKDVLTQANLPSQLVQGKYNFFGNIATQQKYRYILSKQANKWTMIIPYDATVNDVVSNRVDVYMGDLSDRNPDFDSVDKLNHAWHLYEFSQLESSGVGPNVSWSVKPDARPIAETHCSDSTYYRGKESKYLGKSGAQSGKRDRSNKHISKGRIEYSYNNRSWKTGCRIDRYLQVAWRPDDSDLAVESPTSADTWIFKNFIKTSEAYWSQPSNFQLRLLLKGFNESELSPSVLNQLSNSDYIKVRFGTKFMPYGGNQIYKTSLIQYNNFSTMTTDATLWHEVGHAFGLDDEYGATDSDGFPKDNGCRSGLYSAFGTTGYEMCRAGSSGLKSVYHYIAVSRYVLTQICSEDSDCSSNQYCNKRLGLNRCLADGSSELGDACFKNRECGTNRCQGENGNKQCVCASDSDCTNGMCILGTLNIGKNYCRATASTSCPSGWSYETRNPLNRDRCSRTTSQTRPLECKLSVGNRKKNWTGPHAQAGADECRSTKGKSPKPVKCTGGFTHTIRSGADTCTKRVTEHRTPSCPPGWDYKSQTGRDVCQDK